MNNAPFMTPKLLHRESMAIADDAFTAKRKGDTATAVSLFKQALALEQQALALAHMTIPNSLLFEIISRSVESLTKLAEGETA